MINGGGVAGGGLIENSGTGNSTLSGGTITINASPAAGGHFAGAATGSLTVNDYINSPSVAVVSGTGTVIYGGGGNYANLQLQAGTAGLDVNNGLATGAALALGASGRTRPSTWRATTSRWRE